MRPSGNAAARGGFRLLGGCALAWQRRLVFPREDHGGAGAPALRCSLSLEGLRSLVLPHLPQDGLSGLARLAFWAGLRLGEGSPPPWAPPSGEESGPRFLELSMLLVVIL